MLGFLIQGCTNEDKKEIFNTDYSEIEFVVDLLGNPNISKTENNYGSCKTDSELINLIVSERLFINLTIVNKTENKTYNKSAKIVFNGDKYISKPILLNKGIYTVTSATITCELNGTTELIFSAVQKNAAFEKYVPQTIPLNFIIGNNDNELPLFQKSSLDLYMICVIDEEVADFGFSKLDIHYTKLYNVPFSVTCCSEDQQNIKATGEINITNGSFKDDVFIPVSEMTSNKLWAQINETVIFNPQNKTSKICFADNYAIGNSEEYYRITLKIEHPEHKTITGYINTEELLNYKNTSVNDAWDDKHNTINFNFCNNKVWFFNNQPIGH